MAVAPRPSNDRRFKDARSAELGGLLEPTVEAHGLMLEELEIKQAGQGSTLRVVVDYISGTEQVDLDTVAGLSEALSVVLDQHEEKTGTLGDSYELEVSTPGATRPLTEERHFRRNLGRLLEVQRQEGDDLLGRLKEVTDEGITLVPQKPAPKKGMPVKYGDPVQISFTSITRARVQVEFSHTDSENEPEN